MTSGVQTVIKCVFLSFFFRFFYFDEFDEDGFGSVSQENGTSDGNEIGCTSILSSKKKQLQIALPDQSRASHYFFN